MPLLERINGFHHELMAIRHDLHAHPELGFEEVRTSGIVAAYLEALGIEVHRQIGGTGVVGILKGRQGDGPRVGLRADMDALPIEEHTNLPFASRTPGRMHACGHDGHTTMLMGAARYLAETRNFAGTAVFIFQPAEEGLGGARAMLKDGLFERFPCDEIFGLHNAPDLPAGKIAAFAGPAMAGADFFDIVITGKGGHGARPHAANDPVIVAMALGQALQTIVSRNADPMQMAVLSITQIHAGAAYNVIPNEARMAGTVRIFDADLRLQIQARMRELAAGIAQAFGVEIDVDIRDIFSVLQNAEQPTSHVIDVAREIVGEDNLLLEPKPHTGSEDFADMLHAVPGSYFFLGQGHDVPVHNQGYMFDDTILPVGASMLARIVERRLAV
ncbi:hippurate hydrolase [Arboricoccus pini]|uniref:Hippurate hydrolase n=1 Tax=Arboricoccus pini TaxID=1963835 RepID=A0A212RGI7_9PROT|nr:M20 aminoacylase family protein [Arboricoccus pini]SNB71349.1 hippurate hydrolase [Arboricoccus pini]